MWPTRARSLTAARYSPPSTHATRLRRFGARSGLAAPLWNCTSTGFFAFIARLTAVAGGSMGPRRPATRSTSRATGSIGCHGTWERRRGRRARDDHITATYLLGTATTLRRRYVYGESRSGKGGLFPRNARTHAAHHSGEGLCPGRRFSH